MNHGTSNSGARSLPMPCPPQLTALAPEIGPPALIPALAPCSWSPQNSQAVGYFKSKLKTPLPWMAAISGCGLLTLTWLGARC